jgi:hypothetical protein
LSWPYPKRFDKYPILKHFLPHRREGSWAQTIPGHGPAKLAQKARLKEKPDSAASSAFSRAKKKSYFQFL